jgi:hypothetical protein
MDMYFAVDQLAPDFFDNLAGAFAAAASINSNLSLFALIDASFEHVVDKKRPSEWKARATSLYANNEFVRLGDASPFLLPISGDAKEARRELFHVLKDASGIPMISFIACACSIDELSDSFQPFVDVGVDDGQRFLLRFADTRILPVLDGILQDEKNRSWRSKIEHWWMPDRTGQLAALGAPENGNDFDGQVDKLTLNKKSFDALIDAGESDALLDVIFDQNSDLLMDRLPSNAYIVVEKLKLQMQGFKIENFSDRVMFCTTAFAVGECFYMHPDFNKVLQSAEWLPGRLGDALSEISDDSWASVESMTSISA